MSKNTLILIASTIALTGCSDRELGEFAFGIILFFGVPYFFISFSEKIMENSPNSFLAKILKDSDGEGRLLPYWLLGLAWLFCIEKITQSF